MELIILSRKRHKASKVTIGPASLFLVITVLLTLTGVSFYAGKNYSIVNSTDSLTSLYHHTKVAHKKAIEDQRNMIEKAKREAEDNLDALATRLSKLQGHIMRIDALGSRLAAMADIKDIDFNIMEPVGMGGTSPSHLKRTLKISNFIQELEDLGLKVEDRADKLMAIEDMLIDHALSNKTQPAGIPITGGWISSIFGWRLDPISGKREFHDGVDFAGKAGSLVTAVAAGIVTWSDKRYGYGQMIEINHGNGYVTRYAHNKKNLVAVGEKVDKGQPIAIIGSSGRSTGTHVHFEVVQNGKHVNPRQFISVN